MTYLYFILLLLFLSCSNKSVNDENTFIDLNKQEDVSFFELFSKIELYPLEYNDNSLLSFESGESDKIIMHDNQFWFLNKKQGEIIVFDTMGNYIKGLNKKGNGPNEYISINDFLISKQDTLEILSPEGRCIMLYNINNFTFIGRIRLPSEMPVVHFFEKMDKNTYVLYSEANDSKIYQYNIETNTYIEMDYSLPKWINRNTLLSTAKNPFYRLNDSIHYVQTYNGDIYKILPEKNNMKLKYAWDFGDHTFDIEKIPHKKTVEEYIKDARYLNYDYAHHFLIYKENARYFFTRFKFQNRHYHLVVDKYNKKYYLFDRFKEGGQCVPQIIDDKCMYTFVPPMFLSEVIELDLLNQEDRIKLKELDVESNPIIVKYYFK